MSAEIDTGAQLTVNGDAVPLADLATLGDLLARLKIAPQRVVVELNGVIHRRGEGLDGRLQAGDVVEIVHFVGGG
jgi:sulfur carrier protein